MGSNKGGGGSSGTSKSAEAALKQAQTMAQGLYDQSSPLTGGLANIFSQFLGVPGGSWVTTPGQTTTQQVQNPEWNTSRGAWEQGIPRYISQQVQTPGSREWVQNEGAGEQWDPTTSPLWAPGKLAAEQAYGNAQQNILSNMPSGGALLSQLGDTERAKANTMTNLAGNIGQDMFDKAVNFGTGMSSTALSGLTGAGSGLTNLAGTQAAANAQQQSAKLGKSGDLGLGTGMLLGGKAGAPAVTSAAALAS